MDLRHAVTPIKLMSYCLILHADLRIIPSVWRQIFLGICLRMVHHQELLLLQNLVSDCVI